jgi:hypothetical protein
LHYNLIDWVICNLTHEKENNKNYHSIRKLINFRAMLTCALRAQVKKLKMEIKNKFCIENISFETFKTLNAQFPRKND